MKYCTRCVLPYTRPGIVFDEQGNCNCARKADKDLIDWKQREALFREVVANAKARARPNGHDCVIPVSGGKDSTWQVVKALEHGLRPLCVTWRPPARTSLGQKNLDNLRRLGVDHIDWSINPDVEKKFTLKAFERFGSTAVPMHMAIFSIPLRVAVAFRIPLVVWGENSAFEYGGEEEQRQGFKLDREWVRRHGVTHETTARDWVSEDLSEKDIASYFGPSEEELAAANTTAVFLGYYFRWEPHESARIARSNGFSEGRARTGVWDFADIDDDFISLHHWLKWYKFGFTRSYDNLSIDIRNGLITRDNALTTLRKRGDETPHADIEKWCDWLGITKARFFEIAEQFRNKEIWTKNDTGTWEIRDFLIPDWKWDSAAGAGAPDSFDSYERRLDGVVDRCEKLVAAGMPYMAVVVAHEVVRYLYPYEPILQFEHQDPLRFLHVLLDKLIALADAALESVAGYDEATQRFGRYGKSNGESVETRTSALYTALWRSFDSTTMERESVDLLRNRIPDDIVDSHVRGKRVLDMGCGSGRYTLALASLGANVTGVDFKEQSFSRAVELAKAKNLPATFVQADVLELPFPDESFDFVFCNGVLHHTQNMDRGLDEYVRVMRKGGSGFLYLYGTGGAFWHTRRRLRELFRKIPFEYTQHVFDLMGAPGNRFVFCDTWYVPIEHHLSKEEVERAFGARELTFRKLISRNMIDLDRALASSVKDARAVWGDGEHRYLVHRAATDA